MMERVTAPFGPAHGKHQCVLQQAADALAPMGAAVAQMRRGRRLVRLHRFHLRRLLPQRAAPAATTADAIDLLHDEHPPEAAPHDKCRDQRHHPQKKRQREVIGNGRREGLGQLHAQKNEHHRVDEEHDDAPKAAGHQLALGDGSGGEALGAIGHDEARGHHSQNARGAEPFGEQVHEERREYLVEHVDGGALVAAASQGPHGVQPHDAHDHAGSDTAEKQAAELLGGIEGRESPGEGGGTGELEGDNAGRVVDERLAGEQRRLTPLQADRRRECAHSGGIGGGQGGGAGEGGGQRDRGHEPVQHEAHHEHREQHESHGQRQDGALVLPQVAGVRLAGLVEQQRGNEQHEEQLGGDAHVADSRNGQGHYRADGDLHERQRQPRHNLAQHRRADDTSQHNERQFQNFHVRLFSSRNFPLTASIMPTPRFPWCQRPAPVSPLSRPRHVSRCGKASRASQAPRPVHSRTAPFGRARREFAQDFAIGRTQRAQKGRSYSPYRKILHTTIPKHSLYRKILHT